MTEQEPSPEDISNIVDALLMECGIPVDAEPPPAAAFSTTSPSSGDAVRDFVKKDEPIELPKIAPAEERFMAALEDAATNGKVKGQITKGEAQKALKILDELNDEGKRTDVVRAALAGPVAPKLSKGAREALEEVAPTGAGWMDAVKK